MFYDTALNLKDALQDITHTIETHKWQTLVSRFSQFCQEDVTDFPQGRYPLVCTHGTSFTMDNEGHLRLTVWTHDHVVPYGHPLTHERLSCQPDKM